MIKDQFNRTLRDLRISVTDRCNFRCRYCMPIETFGEDYPFLSKEDLLTFDEINRLAGLFAKLGVKKIRITGGEPLLRPDLATLIEKLHQINGIEEVALTTNGLLVPKYAKALKEAGLNRITISLDSLNDQRFGFMNGRGISTEPVLAGIEAAAKAGLRVKINSVVKKGFNEEDILPLAKYFRGTGHTIRFIEYMDVGNSNGWRLDDVVSKNEIIQTLNSEMPLQPIPPGYEGEVADRYRYVGTTDEIGIISSVTDAFCSTCTRARLSADGKLYTCLFAQKGSDLKQELRSGATDEEVMKKITEIWNHRSDRYSEERLEHTKTGASKIEMSYIGG